MAQNLIFSIELLNPYIYITIKRFFYIFLLSLIPVLGFSQDEAQSRPRRTPEEIAQKQTERLQRDLQLTPEQRDTVYQIHLKYISMRRQDEPRDTAQSRISRMIQELMPILTDEQRMAYVQFLKELGPKRQNTQRMRAAEAQIVVVDSIAD